MKRLRNLIKPHFRQLTRQDHIVDDTLGEVNSFRSADPNIDL